MIYYKLHFSLTFDWLKAESQLAILDASAEMRAGQEKTSTFLNMYASDMFTQYTHTHAQVTGKWKSNMLTVGRKRKKLKMQAETPSRT